MTPGPKPKMTPARKSQLLKAKAITGSRAKAATMVGVSDKTVQRAEREDPAFAAGMSVLGLPAAEKDLLNQAFARMFSEAMRGALVVGRDGKIVHDDDGQPVYRVDIEALRR